MNDAEKIGSRSAFWIVLAWSALFGSIIGGLWYGTWQVVVESGQAIAGTVPYESHNSFYQYHIKAWTIAHQITALLLLSGLSAKAVCLIVSAVLGALVFSVLTGIVYALSSHRWLSLAAPFTVLSLLGVNLYYGVAYGVIMFNSHHSNGIIGRNLAILVLILLAASHRRAGFLLLALVPAFHITWGAWIWGIVLCWLLWEKRLARENVKKYAPWFAAGFAITVTSFLYQQFTARGLPVVDAETQSRFLTAFYANWDYHRRAVQLNTPSMYMAIATLAISSVWLRCFRGSLPSATASLLRMFIITSVLSIIACGFAAYPQILPNRINMLMIGRFVNISIAALPVLALGLLASELKRSRFIQWVLAAHFLYVAFNCFFIIFLSSDRFGWRLPHWAEFIALGVILIAYAMHHRMQEHEGDLVSLPKNYVIGIAAAMLCVFGMFGRDAIRDFRDHRPLINQIPFAVVERARHSEGVLIVSGAVQVMQLRTGRPLLINTGGLDQIAFIPSSGPEIARVLEEVYGIDFFNPPEDIKRSRPGALLLNSGRQAWEARTSEEWGIIAEKYGATQIMGFSNWEIQLELVIAADAWALYDLPREAP